MHSKISQENYVWADKKGYRGYSKLCEMKQVQLTDGKVCRDHVHMYLGIPPKYSVSEIMSYLKGKSMLMLFDRHPEYRSRGDKHFWARGYFVASVGNVNEETIRQCIYRIRKKWIKLRDKK